MQQLGETRGALRSIGTTEVVNSSMDIEILTEISLLSNQGNNC